MLLLVHSKETSSLLGNAWCSQNAYKMENATLYFFFLTKFSDTINCNESTTIIICLPTRRNILDCSDLDLSLTIVPSTELYWDIEFFFFIWVQFYCLNLMRLYKFVRNCLKFLSNTILKWCWCVFPRKSDKALTKSKVKAAGFTRPYLLHWTRLIYELSLLREKGS